MTRKITWICRQCFDDKALPAVDQFGKPRGTDIHESNKSSRYCGTCGESHSLERK